MRVQTIMTILAILLLVFWTGAFPPVGSSIVKPVHMHVNIMPPLEFVHVPKTAGSSIEAAAARAGVVWGACHSMRRMAHCSPLREKTKNSTAWGEKYSLWQGRDESWHLPPWSFTKEANPYSGRTTFGVVRSPFDRLVSAVNHRANIEVRLSVKSGSFLDQWLQKKLKGCLTCLHAAADVGQWVRCTSIRSCGTHLLPMEHFFYDTRGKREIDYILRYEALDTMFPLLMSQHGLNVTLANYGLKRHSRTLFTASDLSNGTKALACRLYWGDFQRFKYDSKDCPHDPYDASYKLFPLG